MDFSLFCTSPVRLKLGGHHACATWTTGARRLFIAGYVLHDWLKLPDVEKDLQAAGLSYDTVKLNSTS